MPNLFDEIKTGLAEEEIATLLARPGVRIERIVSTGQTSPQGFWYDQPSDEWVVLLSGSATLEIEGEPDIPLRPGDYVFLPAHKRHRVARTDTDQPSVWLAVHFGDVGGAGADPD